LTRQSTNKIHFPIRAAEETLSIFTDLKGDD